MFINARSSFLKLAIALFVIGVVLLFCLTGCGYADHKDPAIYREASAAAAEQAARLQARDMGGRAEQNLCCGSMEPLIHAGDWLVITHTAFDDHLLGRVAVYQPAWSKGPIAHRLVSGNAREGFIASGDANAHSETAERVTAANYLGEVLAVYKPEFYPGNAPP